MQASSENLQSKDLDDKTYHRITLAIKDIWETHIDESENHKEKETVQMLKEVEMELDSLL